MSHGSDAAAAVFATADAPSASTDAATAVESTAANRPGRRRMGLGNMGTSVIADAVESSGEDGPRGPGSHPACRPRGPPSQIAVIVHWLLVLEFGVHMTAVEPTVE